VNSEKEQPVAEKLPPTGPFQNRKVKRSMLSKAGRRPFLNKTGTKILSTHDQAKGCFGSPKGKKGFVTKYSEDAHKWVEPNAKKVKKTKKPTLE
jgi:hypothetical protein